jgi:hypothetical protein
MKKTLMALALLVAASAAFAAQGMTSGPEPNKQVIFAFAKADNSTSVVVALATSVPNESAKNVQSSGFMIVSFADKKLRFSPLLLNGGGAGAITLLQANARELHPEGYLKM